MHHPTTRLRDAAGINGDAAIAETVRYLFGLDEQADANTNHHEGEKAFRNESTA
jgi:hypothetical protein